tara:strand:+ start:53 stop:544 length:492 start_codon:yes stop_codon:yes gene_type:complete
MSMRLSEHGTFALQSPSATDVGGTTANIGSWSDMKNYARAVMYTELGTWNASDDLDHCRIEEADDSSGSNSGELTSDASGGNYDTDSPIDADGNFVIIEVRAEDMDVDNANPRRYIRGVVGEDGNSGTDDCMAVLVRYGYAYPQKELQGAASSGAQVYADPNT